jgi:predicted phosphoadenosine phosphosulfate sulfurtransferase
MKNKDGRKLYINCNVLEAAKKRIRWIFNKYENIIVSISGGKDSHVVFEIAYKIALESDRIIKVFFLDQEAEYDSSIKVVKQIMNKKNVEPYWYQVPIKMTNATSYESEWFYAWGKNENWLREKDSIAIHSEPNAPERFYDFMDWFEGIQDKKTAFLVGLRTEESLNRFGAVTRNPAIKNINWSSKGKGKSIRFYPVYDWSFEDIWTYMGKYNIEYNRIYDYLWVKNVSINDFRVSFLLHEKSYKSLATLQEFEPENYDKLTKRIKGAHTAGIYSKEHQMYSAKKLPKKFKSWLEYRNFLLEEMAEHRKKRFKNRFDKQPNDINVHRQQVRQLLINDWENNISVNTSKTKEKTENIKEKWMKIL